MSIEGDFDSILCVLNEHGLADDYDVLDRIRAEVDRLRTELADCRELLRLTDTEENRRLREEVERLKAQAAPAAIVTVLRPGGHEFHLFERREDMAGWKPEPTLVPDVTPPVTWWEGYPMDLGRVAGWVWHPAARPGDAAEEGGG